MTWTYGMYYCAAEDQCKFEGVPCGGKCVIDMKNRGSLLKAEHQFACHDGSKCVGKEGDRIEVDICNGKKDCSDGSDEICECNGDIDCKGRLHVKGILKSDIEFDCKSGDERVKMYQYCDGVEDCKDASDEKGCDKCPGLTRCTNGQFTCANVPCNNTVYKTANTQSKIDDLTCEFTSRGGGDWRLCKEPNEEAKCVKGAGGGVGRNLYKGEIIKGHLCNGECLGSDTGAVHSYGYGDRCGDACLPRTYGTPFSCDGSCKHLNKDVNDFVPCGDYCVKRDNLEYSGWSKNAVTCDGECRMIDPQLENFANRKPCNGVCLAGTRGEPWFSCASGDRCFPKEEWCNGVSECKDGTDEASCNQCPEIRKCEHPQHPLTNQTSSKGPGFPDYVCLDEPCGECSDPDTFPCGNTCIPTDQTCPLSGQCSPSRFQCGEECLDLARVCNGKVDCEDGRDEAACDDNMGSWICNGNIQSRAIPC